MKLKRWLLAFSLYGAFVSQMAFSEELGFSKEELEQGLNELDALSKHEDAKRIFQYLFVPWEKKIEAEQKGTLISHSPCGYFIEVQRLKTDGELFSVEMKKVGKAIYFRSKGSLRYAINGKLGEYTIRDGGIRLNGNELISIDNAGYNVIAFGEEADREETYDGLSPLNYCTKCFLIAKGLISKDLSEEEVEQELKKVSTVSGIVMKLESDIIQLKPKVDSGDGEKGFTYDGTFYSLDEDLEFSLTKRERRKIPLTADYLELVRAKLGGSGQ